MASLLILTAIQMGRPSKVMSTDGLQSSYYPGAQIHRLQKTAAGHAASGSGAEGSMSQPSMNVRKPDDGVGMATPQHKSNYVQPSEPMFGSGADGGDDKMNLGIWNWHQQQQHSGGHLDGWDSTNSLQLSGGRATTKQTILGGSGFENRSPKRQNVANAHQAPGGLGSYFSVSTTAATTAVIVTPQQRSSTMISSGLSPENLQYINRLWTSDDARRSASNLVQQFQQFQEQLQQQHPTTTVMNLHQPTQATTSEQHQQQQRQQIYSSSGIRREPFLIEIKPEQEVPSHQQQHQLSSEINDVVEHIFKDTELSANVHSMIMSEVGNLVAGGHFDVDNFVSSTVAHPLPATTSSFPSPGLVASSTVTAIGNDDALQSHSANVIFDPSNLLNLEPIPPLSSTSLAPSCGVAHNPQIHSICNEELSHQRRSASFSAPSTSGFNTGGGGEAASTLPNHGDADSEVRFRQGSMSSASTTSAASFSTDSGVGSGGWRSRAYSFDEHLSHCSTQRSIASGSPDSCSVAGSDVASPSGGGRHHATASSPYATALPFDAGKWLEKLNMSEDIKEMLASKPEIPRQSGGGGGGGEPTMDPMLEEQLRQQVKTSERYWADVKLPNADVMFVGEVHFGMMSSISPPYNVFVQQSTNINRVLQMKFDVSAVVNVQVKFLLILNKRKQLKSD